MGYMIQIFNEDCFETMKRINGVDIVLTSPPYNISASIQGQDMYDEYQDNKTDDEYIDWTVDLFNSFDRIISPNGIVLYNISYSTRNPNMPYQLISNIISRTNWEVGETIIWKKPWAVSVNVLRGHLTRIWEFVIVFCKKGENKTYISNREIKREVGSQIFYKNEYNFIEAPNNDGITDINKATYSTSLCEQLLNLFAPKGSIIYDPFMGTGTTAVACKKLGLDCYGSEISKQQVDYSLERLGETTEGKPIGKFEFDI